MSLTYSIAIRTLGTAGDKFRRELESIRRQTVCPDKVVVYIAEGYPRPEFQVGAEEYVYVKKGMVAQRVLPYTEIDSDCILMLDDDVELPLGGAERLLQSLEENGADCVGADVFCNHEMPLASKLRAVAANLVFPHISKRWAFKIRRNGSFSYNVHPTGDFYLSQSCGGPAMLWRKDSFMALHLEDELWMDSLPFAYGDDALESYKLYLNGGKLGVLYNSGMVNLDARSSSDAFRKDGLYWRTRGKAQSLSWWRMCYHNGMDTPCTRVLALSSYALKTLWMALVLLGVALTEKKADIFRSGVAGIFEGLSLARHGFFDGLPPYSRRDPSFRS